MRPTRPEINSSDRIMVASGGPLDAGFRPPVLPPANPALGDRMRNRNWAAREAEQRYEMQHAPQPWQHSREVAQYEGAPQPHPLAQYADPRRTARPTGMAARGMSTSALDAWTPRRAPVGYIRPTVAYNRVVGPTHYAGAGGNPLNYVTTWPNQYYPGGSNTFIPSWEATGLIVKYTRDPAFFRINRYVKELKVPKTQGYYLTLGADDPYRVVNVNDYLWEDGTDAPGGRGERQAFGFVNYRTVRYCFPFSLGQDSVAQAEWPILAEHAAMVAAKSMTVRTSINYTLATTAANWSGPGFNNTAAATGVWSTKGTSAVNPTPFLQIDLNTGLIAVEQASGGIVSDEEALSFIVNPQEARGIAASDEYRQYIKGSPDALAAITDWKNPNRKYGLAPYIYGLKLAVENAIQVTTQKGANVASPGAQVRSYIWGQSNAVICSKPQGIVAEDEQTLDFSTFCFRFYEQMTTQQKSDPDNRREVGRVIENYTDSLQAPQTGFLFTGCS